MNSEDRIPLAECKACRLYKIRSRNLDYGVYNGNGGFIGIREKFGSRYLFTEYHCDQGPPFGTVAPQRDLGIDVPDEIPVTESVDVAGQQADNTALFAWLENSCRNVGAG